MKDISMIGFFISLILLIVYIAIIMYEFNIFDYRHRWDCYWHENSNATRLYNYDCDKLYYFGQELIPQKINASISIP